MVYQERVGIKKSYYCKNFIHQKKSWLKRIYHCNVKSRKRNFYNIHTFAITKDLK